MPPGSQLWINGLWYTSLLLSLITALLAVLVKQWLHQYMAQSSGTARDRSFIRLYRLEGFQQWQVPLIIGLLPVIMHIALGLFFLGMVVFVAQLYEALAYITALLALLTYIAYIASHICSAMYPQCPYKTPLSALLFIMIQRLSILKHQTISPMTFRDAESNILFHNVKYKFYGLRVLKWIVSSTSNPSAKSLVIQGLGGFPPSFNNEISNIFSTLSHLHTQFNMEWKPLSNMVYKLPVTHNSRSSLLAKFERLYRTDHFIFHQMTAFPLPRGAPTELLALHLSRRSHRFLSEPRITVKSILYILQNNSDIRLHSNVWIGLLEILLLSPTKPEIDSASPEMQPILQLCYQRPCLLDLLDIRNYYDGRKADINKVVSSCTLTWEDLPAIPFFGGVIKEGFLNIFHDYNVETLEKSKFNCLNDDPYLHISFIILNYFQYIQQKISQYYGNFGHSDVLLELDKTVHFIFTAHLLRFRNSFGKRTEIHASNIFIHDISVLKSLSLPIVGHRLSKVHYKLLEVLCTILQDEIFTLELFNNIELKNWFNSNLVRHLLYTDKSYYQNFWFTSIKLLLFGICNNIQEAYDLFVTEDYINLLYPFHHLASVS